MAHQLRGNPMQPDVRAGGRWISICVEATGLLPKAGNYDAAQWFCLRDADSGRRCVQIGQGFSAWDAVLVGTWAYSVVPWRLLLFFGTLRRAFSSSMVVTLYFRCASQRQLCSMWASMLSYARAQPPAGAPCRVARPAAGLRLSPSSSSSSTRRKRCALWRSTLRSPHACLC